MKLAALLLAFVPADDSAHLQFTAERSYDGPFTNVVVGSNRYGDFFYFTKPNDHPTLVLVRAPVQVGDDEKIPLRLKSFSAAGNLATVTDPKFTVSDPLIGVVGLPGVGDPAALAVFVPTGKVGLCTVTATGKNRKGKTISGTLEVEVIAGAAAMIEIEALPVEDK